MVGVERLEDALAPFLRTPAGARTLVPRTPATAGSSDPDRVEFAGMNRETLLNHIRVTHFESGNREQALADALRIAAFLKKQGASRVFGIGSTFEPLRSFTDRSDIDLVVAGIEPRRFFAVSAEAAVLTDFNLDLTALEVATSGLRHSVDQHGIEL